MADAAKAVPQVVLWLRWIARMIILLWALLWLIFTVGSYFHETGQGVEGAIIHLVQIAVLIVIVLFAWWLELIGGLLFLVFAGLTYYQWGQHNIYVLLLMCLPMVVVGVLLILAWVLQRTLPAKAAAGPPPVPPPPPAPPAPGG